jgi:hypothetical protein
VKRKIRLNLLKLRKENLKEKMKMQQDFIEELENRGNANINANKEKIAKLDVEVGIYMTENSIVGEDVFKYTKEQEEVVGAGDKLVKLNNLKGKISQKVSVLLKNISSLLKIRYAPHVLKRLRKNFG